MAVRSGVGGGGRWRHHPPQMPTGPADNRGSSSLGAISWGDVGAFIVPTLLGNCVGGVAFVAAVSTAEIASERGHLGRDKGLGVGKGEDNADGARKRRET